MSFKRSWLVLPVVVLAVLLACSSNLNYSRGSIVGAHDMVLTDSYMFVTSADTDDLRVLQLNVPNSFQRQFLPGPNPLEALVIPTISRPTSLTSDDRYLDGSLAHGQYVIATRPGGAELSIVSSDPSELREVARLVTPAPLTNTTAVKLNDGVSRIYFAAYDGSNSTLYSIDVPADPKALRALSASQLAASVKSVVSFGGDSVSALLVLPGLTGRTYDNQGFCDESVNHCVVVALRRTAGAEGQTLMLDPATLRTAVLNFPGPVRFLTTHGQTVELAGYSLRLGAGERVFAILDEEKCGGAACSGVLAVDTRTAASSGGGYAIARDGSPDGGLPMLPLTFGDAPPVGLTFGVSRADGGSLVRLQTFFGDGGVALVGYSALGVATSSNGAVSFFNANTLLQIDGNNEQAHAQNATFLNASGLSTDYVTGLDPGTAETTLYANNISVADGVWRTQYIYTYWEGIITDGYLPIGAAAATVPLPANLILRVLAGDFLIFQTSTGPCEQARVTSVGESSVTIDAVPEGCASAISFAIRAGPKAPFAIFRTQLPQYLGRAAAGETFVYDAPVNVRTDGYDPGKHALTMRFGHETDIAPPARGALWQFLLSNAYTPYSFVIDSLSVGCGAQLPGQAVYDEKRQRVFVLYPAGNAVVDVDPTLSQRNSVSALQNTYCYR